MKAICVKRYFYITVVRSKLSWKNLNKSSTLKESVDLPTCIELLYAKFEREHNRLVIITKLVIGVSNSRMSVSSFTMAPLCTISVPSLSA